MAAGRDNNNFEILRLSSYPSSSDDDNNTPAPVASEQGWQQTQEVINVDDTPMAYSSPPEQGREPAPPPPTPGDQRREQLLFSSILNRVHRRRTTDSRLHSRNLAPMAGAREPRSVIHEPVAELSQPPSRPSASADIQSIIAFKRLQCYRAYRNSRALGYINPQLLTFSSRRSLQTPSTSSPYNERTPLGPLYESRRRRIESAQSSSITQPAYPHSMDYSQSSYPPAEGYAQSSFSQAAPYSETAPPDQSVEYDDSDDDNDNTNEQFEQETETAENVRLSPLLSEEAPNNSSGNVSIVEVPVEDGEDEVGDRDDDSGPESVEVTESVPQSSNNTTNEDPETSANTSLESQSQPRRSKKKKKSDANETLDAQEFNEKVLRLLECPVCLEWMEPPIWQCRRGHLVCARCRTRLSGCPVCRTSFSSVRNRAMEGVAELMRYPCRYGCGRRAKLRLRDAHEASCAQRRYRCPAPHCNVAPLPLRNIAAHVTKQHPAMVRNGATHKFTVSLTTERHEEWLLLTSFGLFQLCINVEQRTYRLTLYVVFIGPKRLAKEFSYEVTILGQHNGRKLVYSRAAHSDQECSALLLRRQDCFALSLDQAVNYLRVRNKPAQRDRALAIGVHVTKRDLAGSPAANGSDT